MENKNSSNLLDLRQRTKELLHQLPKSSKKLTSNNIHDLLRELQEYIGALEAHNEELKQSLINLEASVDRHRTLQANLPLAVYRSTPDGKFLSINPAMVKMFGYESEKEMLGISAVNLYDNPARREEVKLLLNEKSSVTGFEHQLRRKDGSLIWVSSSAHAVCDSHGKPIHYDGVIQDITERKKTEKALIRSEQKQNMILQAIGAGTWDHDLKTDKILRNDRWAEILGYTSDEVSSDIMGWKDLIHPDDQDKVEKVAIDHKSGKTKEFKIEHRLRTKSGNWKWILNWGMIVDRDEDGIPNRAIGVHLDIDEQKQAKRKIERSEEKYHTLFSTVSDAIMIFDAQSQQIIEINEAAVKLYGYRREEFLQLNLSDITTELEKSKASFDKTLQGGGMQIPLRYHRKKDGTIFPVEISGNVLTIKERKMICGIIRDITERKQAEEKLRDSEKKYRSLVESIDMGIVMIGPDMKILSLNRQMKIMFPGIENSAYQLCHEVINTPPRKKPCVDCPTVKTFADGKVHEAIFEIPLPEGIRHYRFISSPILDDDGQVAAVIKTIEDITERIEAEEKLEKQQYYLSKAQEIGSIGTWELDLIKNKLIWTEENYRVFGVPLGTKLNYETFLNHVHPDDREFVDREWKAAIGGKPYDIEHRLIADGEVKWVREKADVQFNKDGQAVYAIGFTQEITKHKQAEEALRVSEKFNRAIVENSPMGISVRSSKGKLISANQAWQKIWNISDDKLKDYLTAKPKKLTLNEKDDYLRDWKGDVEKYTKRVEY